MTDPTPEADLGEAYFSRLWTLVEICQRCTKAGLAPIPVLLGHELARYLYPSEPYAGFHHTDPARFLVTHLDRLIRLGRAALEGISGYPPQPDPAPAAGTGLAAATSALYTDLWRRFDRATLVEESRRLLERRLPPEIIETHIRGRWVLDMGCGSGRYALALALLGAESVTAVDYRAPAFAASQALAFELDLPVRFLSADVLALPFSDRQFDFVFSNGVLHHTRSWRRGLDEVRRVMKRAGYLYLYGAGGFFWATRAALREVFRAIPKDTAASVLALINMPPNRFIFMDSWYVPIEDHITRAELGVELDRLGLDATPLPSFVPTDPGYGLAQGLPDAALVWGEGEHRLLVTRR